MRQLCQAVPSVPRGEWGISFLHFWLYLTQPPVSLNPEFQSLGIMRVRGRKSRLACSKSACFVHIPLAPGRGLPIISLLSLTVISPTQRHSPSSLTWNQDRRKSQEKKKQNNLLTKDTSPGISETLPLLNT